MNMDKPTREQVLAEPAGRDLDGWVATFVMGWTEVGDPGHGCDWGGFPPGVKPFSAPDGTSGWKTLPRYSTDIAAAWSLTERLFGWELEQLSLSWQATVHAGVAAEKYATGTTAPLAICRAALLAVVS